MTIEKSPTAAAQPAAHTKGPSPAKASKGAAAESKSSGQDAFMDLLLGLSADDAELPDSAMVGLPVPDVFVPAPDPQAESAVAILAQQDWIPVAIPTINAHQNAGLEPAQVHGTVLKESIPSISTRSEPVKLERDSKVVSELADNPLPPVFTDLTVTANPKVEIAAITMGEVLTTPKVERLSNSLEMMAQSLQPNKSLEKPEYLKVPVVERKLPAGRSEINARFENLSLREVGSKQFERNLLRDVTPNLEATRLVGVSNGNEYNLIGAGVQPELRREKIIFKSSVSEANNTIHSGTKMSQPSSNLEAFAYEGSVVSTLGESDQGAYWVSADMKSAEMTLDGIGEGAVEVSISLHGKEAHVSFRTDEEQTRTALQDAEGTLKDMLQREGLALSSVSIGLAGENLGSRSGRDQGSQTRADLQQFKIESRSQLSDGESLSPLGGRQSGNVDIFV